jgi:hypothetical protein
MTKVNEVQGGVRDNAGDEGGIGSQFNLMTVFSDVCYSPRTYLFIINVLCFFFCDPLDRITFKSLF